MIDPISASVPNAEPTEPAWVKIQSSRRPEEILCSCKYTQEDDMLESMVLSVRLAKESSGNPSATF